MHCESEEHDPPVTAIATVHDSDSESAANITFLCGGCLVELVREVFVNGLPDDRYNLEIRPLTDDDGDDFGDDDDDFDPAVILDDYDFGDDTLGGEE